MKILLAGKLQHDNFGDVIMAVYYMDKDNEFYLYNSTEDVLTRVQELGYNAKLICYEDLNEAGIEKAVFIGGGYFGHTYLNWFSWCNSWEGKNELHKLARYFSENDIKYIVHSVEVGPLFLKSLRNKVKYIFSNAEKVVVRNIGSKEYCSRKLGIEPECYGDIVYHESAGFFSSYLKEGKENLVIHVTDKYIESNAYKRAFVKSVKKYIKENFNKYKNVVFITDNEVTCNLDVAIEELESYASSNNIPYHVVRYKGSNITKIFEELSQAKLIITTKLHLGVLAKSFGANVKCYTDAPKSYRFYKDNNSRDEIEGFYFRLSKISSIDVENNSFVNAPKSNIYLSDYKTFLDK